MEVGACAAVAAAAGLGAWIGGGSSNQRFAETNLPCSAKSTPEGRHSPTMVDGGGGNRNNAGGEAAISARVQTLS